MCLELLSELLLMNLRLMTNPIGEFKITVVFAHSDFIHQSIFLAQGHGEPGSTYPGYRQDSSSQPRRWEAGMLTTKPPCTPTPFPHHLIVCLKNMWEIEPILFQSTIQQDWCQHLHIQTASLGSKSMMGSRGGQDLVILYAMRLHAHWRTVCDETTLFSVKLFTGITGPLLE